MSCSIVCALRSMNGLISWAMELSIPGNSAQIVVSVVFGVLQIKQQDQRFKSPQVQRKTTAETPSGARGF
jgi:hypothetical protein